MQTIVIRPKIYAGEEISYEKYLALPQKEFELPSYEYYVKQNTVLFEFIDKFIDPKYQLDCKKAMSFIGYCHVTIPGDRNKMNDIGRFNNGMFKYSPRRFGYVPKNPHPEFKQLTEIAFSASGCRFMCIKAEFMIFSLFYFMSRDASDAAILQKMISYCCDMYNSHDGCLSERMARYIFELTTAFSFFVFIYNEAEQCLPAAHTPAIPLKFSNISEFASFIIFDEDPKSTEYCLQPSPRCSTVCPLTTKRYFYVPMDTDIRVACTIAAKQTMEKVQKSQSVQEFLTILVEMLSYEREHLVTSGSCRNPEYAVFPSIVEAEEFTSGITLKPEIREMTIFVLKIGTTTQSQTIVLSA